jgi:hypothetical protein
MTFKQFVCRIAKTLWEILLTDIEIQKIRMQRRWFRLQNWYWDRELKQLQEKRYQRELKSLNLRPYLIWHNEYYNREDLAKLTALNLKYGRK